MLQGQAAYGKQRAEAQDDLIALGRNLYPTLPEEKFDLGPQRLGPMLLVADVRIDNREELAAALGIGAPALAFMSDSALLMRGLVQWEEAAAERLVGEFAFAAWDGQRQRLLLARDIMGMRPLHFHDGDGFFAFASMPSGLHSLPEIRREVNHEFVREQLVLLPNSPDGTFWRGVRRVQPGHLVTVTREGVRSQRFWRPPEADPVPLSPRDYEEGMRDVIETAVKSQLRGNGDAVATHLSSGLDSSIVTATAARLHAPKEVVAFTGVPRRGFSGPVPRGTYADEAELAAVTARQFRNVRHIPIDGAGGSPLAALSADCAYMQQPPPNLCNLVWINAIYAAAKDRGLTTLLMAAGGNATITYAGTEWLAYLLRRGRLLELASNIRALRANGRSIPGLLAQTVGPFLPSFLWRAVLQHQGRAQGLSEYSAINPQFVPELERKAAESKLDFLYRPRSDPAEARHWMFERTDGGNSVKAVLARWGISVRDPTTDKRVIEFCLRLPYEEFLRGGVQRSIARRAFADRLPEPIVRNNLRGYQAADWYEGLAADRDGLAELVQAAARSPRARESLDTDWMRETLERWPEDGWDRHSTIQRFRGGLLRATSTAHFIRWAEGSNE